VAQTEGEWERAVLREKFPSLKGFNRGPDEQWITTNGWKSISFHPSKGSTVAQTTSDLYDYEQDDEVSIPQRVQPWPRPALEVEGAVVDGTFPSLKGFNRGPDMFSKRS